VNELAPHAAIAVDAGVARSFAGAIIQLMNDSEKMGALGRAAQAFALARDADWTSDQFERIYEELVTGRGERS
jgi:hypothetical protein